MRDLRRFSTRTIEFGLLVGSLHFTYFGCICGKHFREYKFTVKRRWFDRLAKLSFENEYVKYIFVESPTGSGLPWFDVY